MSSITYTPVMLIIPLIYGMIAAYLANQANKNPYFWFFIGCVLGTAGIFAIFLLPLQKRAMGRKKRTKQISHIPLIRGPQDKFWYYLDPSHTQIGPVSYHALLKEFRSGTVSDTTYVWNELETEWRLLKEFKGVGKL